MYKSKLQELCDQRKWAMPKYSCMSDGPDHSLRFKATVIVNGESFDAEPVCRSLKEACNEAAKLAFLHFNHELADGYKKKLQIYAKRNNLGLPMYHCEKEGPPDALRFKACVTVSGDTYESKEAYDTMDDAETAAAQIALFSLLTSAFSGKNTNSYKNLLQELAQTEGWLLPMYRTVSSVDRRDPSFVSTVKVEGKSFSGEAAKSKKQAELNAAMAAYAVLTEGKNSGSKCSPRSLPSGTAAPSDTTPLEDLSALSISGPSEKKTAEIKSYLLCNKVRVYTSISDIVLPEGTVLLPIADNKWVAASLEFKN